MPKAWRKLDWREKPAAVAKRLATRTGFVWLDSSLPDGGCHSILTAEPNAIFTGNIGRDWQAVVRAVAEGTESGCAGGLFGWVGFDGEFVLGRYPHALLYDHATAVWFECGAGAVSWEGINFDQADVFGRLDFQPMVGREEFVGQVRRAQEYIAAGDVYQVNLAVPWVAEWDRQWSWFRYHTCLRAISPAPQAACLRLAGTTVLSASPELFLKMEGCSIFTKPIKGTRPRHPEDAGRDAASARELVSSPKERAELLMITDLERNDLGQVCEFGSVTVPELWRVESFAQVFHLVSTVKGTLRPAVSHAEAFRACFPGGSISGAPKKRALEIIRELEPHPRGIYTGAIGYFGFDGASQWNIAIRTAVQQGGRLSFHVGSGIVADSVAEHEWEETLYKASGMLAAARLFEDDGFVAVD